MTILAMASQKGGVGKTTIALNLAYSFARRGWTTLLVDGDPQGGIGLSLTGDLAARNGLVECLEDGLTATEVALETKLPELQILPNGQDTGDRAWRLQAVLRVPDRLGTFLAAAADSHQITILDTASGMYGATWELLRGADTLLVPLPAEPLAARSLNQVFDAFQRLRQDGSATRIAGFVLTMVNTAGDVSGAVVREVWGSLPTDMLLTPLVPRDEAILKASAAGVPVGLLSRRPPAVAAVFEQIAAEIEPRLGLNHEDAESEPIPLWP